jgi:hypothetical protein
MRSVSRRLIFLPAECILILAIMYYSKIGDFEGCGVKILVKSRAGFEFWSMRYQHHLS